MTAPKDLIIPIRVGETRGRFAAAAELAGTPICTYGETEEEAVRGAKGAILRLLGNVVQRGDAAEFETLRFKVLDV